MNIKKILKDPKFHIWLYMLAAFVLTVVTLYLIWRF